MLRAMAVLMCLALPGGMATAQAPPEHATCPLHLQITDEDGGVINHAFVLLHGDRSIKLNQQVTLDAKGAFKANLRAGLYDLFVSSPGFLPVAQVVDLRACKPVSVNLMLLVDSEHAEGDQF